MPKQVATPERSARTIRSRPELMDAVDAVAISRGQTFNDTANEFLEVGVALASLDAEVREALVEAATLAAALLKASKVEPNGNLRLLNAQRLLRMTVQDAFRRRLRSPTPFASSELWAAVVEIIEELTLEGLPWTLITEMRVGGPPLSNGEIELINAGIERQARSQRLNEEQKARVEMLGVYADHAHRVHLEDWEEFQRSVRNDLDRALGVQRDVTE